MDRRCTGQLSQELLYRGEVQMGLYRLSFVAGFAAGFVAGSRAGRDAYDQIVKYARTAAEHPTVQQARGTVQTQATGLAQKVSGQLADRVPQMAHSAAQSVGGKIPGARHKDGHGATGGKETGDGHPFAKSTGGNHRPSSGPDTSSH
jgi:hypothetical protein